jgi:hypothetical protein
LGEIPWGRAVPVTFALANASANPITICRVDADCGCAAPTSSYEGAVVAPGASARIDFLMNSGFDTGPGERQFRVALQSGEVLVSVVRAVVMGSYSVSETAVNFGDVDMGAREPVRRRVRFVSRDTQLREVRADCDWIDAKFSGTPEGADVVAEVVPGRLDVGVSYAGLLLSTTDTDRPTFRVALRVNGIAELMPVPSGVYLRRGDTALVEFRDRDMARVRLRSCEAGPPELDTQVIADGRLSVSASGAWNRGSRARVRVHDDAGRVGFLHVCAIID